MYHDLRTAIITGTIHGGTRLVESTLATEMNVSRTPIQEALHKLAVEGLLYSIPRAGYIVEEMSDYDIRDLFTIRMSIEQIAASAWAGGIHLSGDEILNSRFHARKIYAEEEKPCLVSSARS